MIDPNEFFREMTVRISGDLEVEKAMRSCVQYLQALLPVEKMVLQQYEPGLEAIRTIASATTEEAKALDLLTPMPGHLIQEGAEALEHIAAVRCANRPGEDPTSRQILEFHGMDADNTSLLIMVLLGDVLALGQPVGVAVFMCPGRDAFTDEHAALFAPLAEPFAVAMSNALKHREVVELKELLIDDRRQLQNDLQERIGDEIIGQDFGLRPVMEMIHRVAPLDSPVLLLGETGVGKDVLANALHRVSSRRDQPFVALNTGAIPEELLDSELFGHEKGAFTGALSERRGRFERAHQGSIFLDEIGELPPRAQVRLLRVLQNQEVERIGGDRTIQVDTRVIAATHRDLNQMVQDGSFREDLFFRLNVFPITIPALRERKEDIPAFASFFIQKKSRELRLAAPPEIEPGALEPLLEYDWPGNVREFENVIERALILQQGRLRFDDLLGRPKDRGRSAGSNDSWATLDEVAAGHIRKALAETGHRIHGPEGAARLLGINPSTLRNRMKKLGIASKPSPA